MKATDGNSKKRVPDGGLATPERRRRDVNKTNVEAGASTRYVAKHYDDEGFEVDDEGNLIH